ncbi:BglG family transcription antiterminator [Salimicrobium salexigens]|uniref:Activator of the mannose operon, transcriptional antiterminator n=1 Tax=Salimicrobium salexigens TaxID=908941 RepID=A0ABY1KKL7_9BACI|nr:BglG family transcription antiterminator [Salimicrobium salexigens]SIS45913.1 activator of the mannose operon, transcriptional antiterminator [Salimicrobium salexigens]
MNDRQMDLLHKLLLQSGDFTYIKALAGELGCSEKTIRNDLKEVGLFLETHSRAQLIRKPGAGVQVSVGEEERERIFKLLHTGSDKDTKRRQEIGYRLLVEKNPLTVSRLTREFFVSVKEIKKDLSIISDWLISYNIELISRQRRGVTVTGEELSRRNALAHLYELSSRQSGTPRSLLMLFPDHEVTYVNKKISDLMDEWNWKISSDEQENLLIHLLIILKRVRQSSAILMKNDEVVQVRGTREYTMTEELSERINDQLKVSLPVSEKVYFTLHLLSYSAGDSLQKDEHIDSLVHELGAQLTNQLQIMTVVPFDQDDILEEGLHVHLPSAVHRVANGLTIRNPMLEEIKNMYPYMFSMVVMALEEVNKRHSLSVPEDEAAYLVLHFQASLERLNKKRDARKKVVIVCELGIGMSHLLQAKLEQSYQDMEVVGSIGTGGLEGMITDHHVDFIISTRELEEPRLPVVVISPLLKAEDRRKIDRFLHVKETGPIDSPSINAWLEEGEIELGIDPVHRYELIEELGRKLVQKGKVSSQFPAKAVMREKMSATEIGNGIAIPHAPPEEVYQSSVSLAVFKEPVLWRKEKVSVVFLLAISNKDRESMKPLMNMISRLGAETHLLEQLKNATTFEMVEDVLK